MKMYWSLSKFADFLRILFGISKMPNALNNKGWVDYECMSKQQSKFGYTTIEFLDVIQEIVSYIPDKISHMISYIGNRANGSHVLRTTTQRGQWGDLVTKIPDALMCSIIDFVEIECFNMQNNFGGEAKLTSNPKVGGLDWIYFQIRYCEDKVTNPYNHLIAAYWFAKNEYFVFDAYEGVECNSYTFNGHPPTDFDLVTKREKEFNDKVSLHCNSIVKYRDYLWT